MFVKFMYADRWINRIDQGSSVANPTWDQVREAIAALDGRQNTIVSLTDEEGHDAYLIVAGQWDRRFMVNATTDNVGFFSLVDSTLPDNKVMLYVGGQDGEYESRKCVCLKAMLEAVEYYYERGELKAGMNWESDY